MKQFTYKALDRSGTNVGGTVESLTEASAARSLQEKGMFVVALSAKRDFSLGSISIGSNRVGLRDTATFTRLLATMLGAGLPLTDALGNLAGQFKGKYFREVITTILRDVQSGVSLSNALSQYPQVFPNLYVSLIRAGEASGKADETMARLADTLEANLEFRAKIKGAMIYPAIVVVAMTAIGFFMITSIIPRIAEVYKQFGAELPLPTRILVGISDVISGFWYIVLIVIGIIIFIVRTLRKNSVSDQAINNLLFKLPIFGSLNKDAMLTVFCRTLATLLFSGVAIVDGLKIVAEAMGNNYFRTGLLSAAMAVEKGLPLSISFKKNNDFPVMVSQLVAIGEQTGTLDESLERLAKFYQDSAERKSKMLTTALEPLMLLLMGLMVGGLAVAVLLPMFNLANVIKT